MAWMSYAVITAALTLVGFVGGKATDIGPWYRELRKPSWNPPDWVFPVVWTTIYLFIIVSVGRVWNQADPSMRSTLLLVISVNLILNMLWSVLFFSWKKPLWALIEVVLLWLSIVAMIAVFVGIDQLSAWLLAPYLAWVSVASFLNLSIIRLNPEVIRSHPAD